MGRPLIAIVGPTAAGKSQLALRLARERKGEVVSCDSLQVYRGLDIGSAKASPAERNVVPHHLLDVVDPDEEFSAADYARLARAALRDIARRGRLPVVVGGAGLYLRALIQGLFPGPSRDEAFRRRLKSLASRRGSARLHRLLSRVDPRSAARIHPEDRVRIVRALEVFHTTGLPLSRHLARPHEALGGFSVLLLGIALERDELRRSVERRTERMFKEGLVDEVRGLLAKGYSPDLRPLRAIGYRQVLQVIHGERDSEEAQRDIVTETMRYAKRQMTWFRHHGEVRWFPDGRSAYAAAQAWLSETG